MSTIAQIIALVDETKPNAFSESVKVRWIAELDGKIAVDVFLMHRNETAALCYKWPESMNTEPLVPFPHDDIYTLWLEAKIDYANGEYNKYQNSMESYNESYGNFLRWFTRVYRPAQGGGCGFEMRSDVTQYYITAYGLAVRQGYTGTLDEWLASLVGPKGDPGVSAYKFALAGGFVGTESDFVYKLCHDGKTAWEYAVEGGYKGTEDEFTALMANAANKEDIPKIDETLSQEGQAADAAAVGAALANFGFGGNADGDEAFMQIIDARIAKMPEDSVRHISIMSGGRHSITIHKHLNGYVSIEDVSYAMSMGYNTYWYRRVRCLYNSIWGEWEYENPPLTIGGEYRTTERWKGLPVYTKAIYMGNLPNNGTIAQSTKGVNASKIVRILGTAYADSAGGICVSLPFINNDRTVSASVVVIGDECHITTWDDRSSYTAYVRIWYIKT